MPDRSAGPTRILTAVAALAATAVAVYFGTGLHPLWWLTWVAPVPVLLLAPRLSGWGAFLVAFAGWALGSLNMWGYLRVVEVPGLPALGAIALPSLVFAVAVVGYRMRVRRGDLVTGVFFVPALWVAYEYVMNLLSPHGTFGNLGYSQLDFLPVVQLASVTGIWGIDFCLLFFAAALAGSLSGFGSRRQQRAVAVAALAWFVAVFGYAAVRLVARPDSRAGQSGLDRLRRAATPVSQAGSRRSRVPGIRRAN